MVSARHQPRGGKTAMIHDAVNGFSGDFSVADIVNKCPGVGIECLGRGRNARWSKKKGN